MQIATTERILPYMDRYALKIAPDGYYSGSSLKYWIAPDLEIKISLFRGGYYDLTDPRNPYPVPGSNPMGIWLLKNAPPETVEFGEKRKLICRDGGTLRKAYREVNEFAEMNERENGAYRESVDAYVERWKKEVRDIKFILGYAVLGKSGRNFYRGSSLAIYRALLDFGTKDLETDLRLQPQIKSFWKLGELLEYWKEIEDPEYFTVGIANERSKKREYGLTVTGERIES